MGRRTLLALFVVAGCGVQINGDERNATPDSAQQQQQQDAGSDGPPPVDAPSFVAACMAKGYMASGALTSLYRTGATSKSWLDAGTECAADVPGATHLIVLSSTGESQLMQTKLGWVGLSDRTTENLFVNVTAEPNDQRPFLSGQPDNGNGTEDCVQMKTGGLDDDQCDNAHVFVCECDGRAPAP